MDERTADALKLAFIGRFVAERKPRQHEYWLEKSRRSAVPVDVHAQIRQALEESGADRNITSLSQTAMLWGEAWAQLSGRRFGLAAEAHYGMVYVFTICAFKRYDETRARFERIKAQGDSGVFDLTVLDALGIITAESDSEELVRKWDRFIVGSTQYHTMADVAAELDQIIERQHQRAMATMLNMLIQTTLALEPRRFGRGTLAFAMSVLSAKHASPARLLRVEQVIEDYFSSKSSSPEM
ncbi:hypothetical protein HGA91_02490 [candidate division WWE3 bacterium]|nr:hypothetical protein [candidate division WWE3 bacterium]